MRDSPSESFFESCIMLNIHIDITGPTVPECSLLVEDWVLVNVWHAVALGHWCRLLLDDLVRQLEPQWTKDVP